MSFKTKTKLNETLSSLNRIHNFLREGTADDRQFLLKVNNRSLIFTDKKTKQIIHYSNELFSNYLSTSRLYNLNLLIDTLKTYYDDNKLDFDIPDVLADCSVVRLSAGDGFVVECDMKYFSDLDNKIGNFNIGSFSKLKDNSENYSNSIDLKFDNESNSVYQVIKKWSNKKVYPTEVFISNESTGKVNSQRKFGFIYIPFSIAELSSSKIDKDTMTIYRLNNILPDGEVFMVELTCHKTKEISWRANYPLLNIPYYNVN